MSYRIEITFMHVPVALEGVPLPIEIVHANGVVQRDLLTILENRPESRQVQAPGYYLIRTELPSGRWLAETTTLPDPVDAQGEVVGTVTLDFGAEELQSNGSLQPPIAKYLPPRVESAEQLAPQEALSALALPAVMPVAVLDYGLFQGWRNEPGSANAAPTDTLLVQWHETGDRTDLPGTISLPQHLGWTPNSTDWRPVLVRVKLPASMDGTPSAEALLATPPAYSDRPLTLLPDPDTGNNPDAPQLLALWESGHKVADALFSYVRGGALDLAQAAAPTLIAQAETMLAQEDANPIHATIAAYVLLKIGYTQRTEWTEILANRFRFLPDNAIIYGWHLINAGRAEQAYQFFRMALERGLPMYSEGVRLLRDGLNFLSGIYRTDSGVQDDMAFAYRIAAAANFDSELTCLRLGGSLVITEKQRDTP